MGLRSMRAGSRPPGGRSRTLARQRRRLLAEAPASLAASASAAARERPPATSASDLRTAASRDAATARCASPASAQGGAWFAVVAGCGLAGAAALRVLRRGPARAATGRLSAGARHGHCRFSDPATTIARRRVAM